MTSITSNETKGQTIVTIKQLFWDDVNKIYRAYDIDLYDGVAEESDYAYKTGHKVRDASPDRIVYDIPLGTGVVLGDTETTVASAAETNEKLDGEWGAGAIHPNFDGLLWKITSVFEGFGSKEELIHDTPSIGFPIDNDAQDLTTLGEIGEQKEWGQMKVDGKLDKWKSNRRYEATCLGRVWSNAYGLPVGLRHCGYPQAVDRGCQFKRGWNAPVFRIKVYKNNVDTNDKPKRNVVPEATDKGDELRIYNGVRFLNWTPTEDQPRIKESLSFSVEDVTVIRNYTIVAPGDVEYEYQPEGYDYTP